MHFSTALATVAAVAPLVSAHGSGVPLPRIVGLNPRDLKARDLLSSLGARFTEVHEFHKEGVLEARADDRECGASIGTCAAGQCCSQSGYCGTGDDYCYSPGCDYKYGPACPDNAIPSGTNTSSIARTTLGNVAVGGDGIYNCITAGTIALTYDDGPAKTLTAHILDLMKTYDAKATFFVTGNNINKGQIDLTQEYIDVIKRMDTEGHQIASHTWTHLDLSAISSLDRKNQMWKNEMALRNILGKIPTYMRPPYSSCTGECETDMAELGYHVIYFDVDTDDYNQDDPSKIQKSKDWFTGNITAGGATAAGGAKWLDIQHDIHVQTANNLTEYMLQTIKTLGYKAVTVGECLGDPSANWYRAASGAGTSASSTLSTATRSSSAPASTGTKKVTTDATCGGTNGYTCLNSSFGNCCSTSGWCGSTTDYCGTGCQSAFGNCGSNGGVSSSAVSSTKAPSSTSKPASSTPTPASSTKAASSTSKLVSSTKASSAAPATSTKKASTDGTCAGSQGFTCSGSTFGTCCSAYGWCGSTTDHCGSNCQSGFGTCSGSASASSAAASSAATPSASVIKKVSTDGSCAGTSGFTCLGSTYGICCSQYGWCGSTTGHCGTGCNTSFGMCV